jgi:RNA polymerase sigma factor (sigma-70 family)
MDARSRRRRRDGAAEGAFAAADGSNGVRSFSPGLIGQLLGEWHAREVRVAQGFFECAGLSLEQVEDLYQETAVALMGRPYESEQHLRRGLRRGIKQRALREHRDQRLRLGILAQSVPGLREAAARAGEREGVPEQAVLAREDRLVVAEFLAALSAIERRVFVLLAEEDLSYFAIGSALGIPAGRARTVTRSCERKRERFQVLYEAGRLCGFRAQTIRSLQSGRATGEQLAQAAIVHVEGCARCRAEHRTSAQRLRASFRGQAVALLPGPLLAGRVGWLARAGVRLGGWQQRFSPQGTGLGGGLVRERAVAILAGGGMSAKVAAGVLTVATITAGTIGVGHVLERSSPRPVPRATATRMQTTAGPGTDVQSAVRVSGMVLARASTRASVSALAVHEHASGVEHASGASEPAGASSSVARREPGGFAYLGVPRPAPTPVQTPSSDTSAGEAASAGEQHGGGPFSP